MPDQLGITRSSAVRAALHKGVVAGSNPAVAPSANFEGRPMSYCRFSDDDFSCDAYIYQSLDGWMIHVAGARLAEPLPRTAHLIPTGTDISNPKKWEAYFAAKVESSKLLETAEFAAINHPLAGASLRLSSLEECLAKVIELKSDGFRVPDFVVEAMRDEIAEGNDSEISN